MPTVNMRHNMRTGLITVFGDQRSEDLYMSEVNLARARLAPGEYVVAPRMHVSGTRLGTVAAGGALTLLDMLDEIDAQGRVVAAAARWRRLIDSGVVLEGGW